MSRRTRFFVQYIVAAFLFLSAGQPGLLTAEGSYSPYVNQDYPDQLLWGDTHLHTTNSLDARMFGLLLDVEDAYRFARGETVMATGGLLAKLGRPLDFLAVTDHSDAIGVVGQLVQGHPDLLEYKDLRDMREKLLTGDWGAEEVVRVIFPVLMGDYSGPFLDRNVMRSAWEAYVDVADQFNDPGKFTAMVGYEWTSTTGRDDGDNLHRNVLYRNGGQIARQVLPFTVAESVDPRALWNWMERYEEETGGQVLALAHNGNLSNGQMFPVEVIPKNGAAIDAEYVKTRARWEPLYEVTQIKGDGEAHPILSPTDEFADFETLDMGNAALSVLKTSDMLQYEYAREALKNGLKLEATLGANPYQFGMVGSTDSHTALATADENNYFGKSPAFEPGKERLFKGLGFPGAKQYAGWELGAAGYAAVWAQENTRESIWDAMQRREVYATTGPRMTVRFFGGWSFLDNEANLPGLARTGYGKGVPMGGVLPAREGKNSPRFLISALKDPDGANLDRVQVVKGWLDSRGETQEEVYDVVWSGDRKHNAEGRLPAVGNSVNVEQASYSNSIGAAQLTTVWQDPDFDERESAFYYVRVIEIPTPRWTAYDANYFDFELPVEVPTTIQERAYTSPIWYQPEN